MTVSQTMFRQALLDPGAPTPAGLRDGGAAPAGRRFDVYRNNVAVSLTEALHQGFPVIAKLLGKQNMDGLSGMFLRAHPPTSPLMMHYGDAFPDFLATLPQLQHLAYLPDVARLELGLRQSYHAADHVPLPAETLAALPPEEMLAHGVRLAASAVLLRSDWPIHDIWRFNTEDGAPKPQAGAQDVLITRPEFDPIPRLLPPAGADWIAALSAGASLGEAYVQAASQTPDFDPGAVLTLLLQDGVIAELTKQGEQP